MTSWMLSLLLRRRRSVVLRMVELLKWTITSQLDLLHGLSHRSVWCSLLSHLINNNNNNNDDIYSAVFIAEPLREFTRFTRWIQKWRQVATDLWTKPTSLSRRPAYNLYRQPVNHIHHRHLLSLLSPKADTHFIVPQRVEGWVDLGGCYIPRRFTRPQTVTHPSTDQAWHTVTSLICPTTLPLD